MFFVFPMGGKFVKCNSRPIGLFTVMRLQQGFMR